MAEFVLPSWLLAILVGIIVVWLVSVLMSSGVAGAASVALNALILFVIGYFTLWLVQKLTTNA